MQSFTDDKDFLNKVEEQAQAEVLDEMFRNRVEEEKTRIRNRRPFWHRIFPCKIVRR